MRKIFYVMALIGINCLFSGDQPKQTSVKQTITITVEIEYKTSTIKDSFLDISDK